MARRDEAAQHEMVDLWFGATVAAQKILGWTNPLEV